LNPKENLIAAVTHRQTEWVSCPLVDGSWSVVLHNLTERPEGKKGLDDWGIYWDISNAAGGSFPTKHPLDSLEKIKDYQPPDVEKPSLFDSARKAVQNIDRSETLIFADNGWGIFERAWMLAGMDNLLIWMIQEPEAVNILMEKITHIKLRITERFIKEVSVDGIMYGDDWGGEQSILMGPELWRKFIKPRQKKLYDVCKENNVFIRQHSDGHIQEIFPDLVEMGLDILNPLQPECNDTEKAKKDFGDKLAFHGAVSSRLMDTGTPEQVTEEVKTRINQLGKNGGYILAPAHELPYPEKNIQAFKNAAVKYGRIPGKWQKRNSSGRSDISI
jgi:uroporphyrinogen decarboxylase